MEPNVVHEQVRFGYGKKELKVCNLKIIVFKKTPSSRSRTSDLRMSAFLSNYSPPLYQLSYRRKPWQSNKRFGISEANDEAQEMQGVAIAAATHKAVNGARF